LKAKACLKTKAGMRKRKPRAFKTKAKSKKQALAKVEQRRESQSKGFAAPQGQY
jgi:hypothetical protein